jgi:hypothetical protein
MRLSPTALRGDFFRILGVGWLNIGCFGTLSYIISSTFE